MRNGLEQFAENRLGRSFSAGDGIGNSHPVAGNPGDGQTRILSSQLLNFFDMFEMTDVILWHGSFVSDDLHKIGFATNSKGFVKLFANEFQELIVGLMEQFRL